MKRRLILITLALTLLVVGMNLLTRGEYLSGKVKGYIVAAARQELGYDVGMGAVVLNFFPTYVDIEKPYVRGWDKGNAARSVSADKVRVYFSLPALLNKSVQIRRVQLYRPSIEVERASGGGYNIDPLQAKIKELLERKGGPGAYRVEVREVVLFDGVMTYSDPAQGTSVKVGNAGMDFRMFGKDHYWISCKVGDLVAKRADLPSMRLDISGEALWKDGKAKIDTLRVESEGTSVKAKGEVIWSKTPVLDIRLEALVNLALLDRFALWKGGPAGEAEVDGVVKGAYPKLEGSGKLALRKIIYAGIKVDDLSSEVSFRNGALNIPTIKSRLLGGSIEGQASVDIGGNTFVYTSSWTLKDLISGNYTEADKGISFLPWYRVSGKVSLSGKGMDASALAASGYIDLKKYEKPHADRDLSSELDIINGLHAGFRLKDRTIHVDSGTVSSKYSDIAFNGTVGLDGVSDLAIKGHSRNIGEISTIIGYSDIQGKLDVTGYVSGNIAEPVIQGKAQISDAYVHGVPFKSAYGDVKLAGWVLSFRDFLLNQDKGSFLLNGRIAFKGEGASFLNPMFYAKLGVRGVSARKIISIFYEDIPVDLTADGEIGFKGNLDRFKGDAHLATGQGAVYGQSVDKGEVNAVLSEKSITFPKIVAVKDRDIVNASGGIGFDGTFYGKATSARFDLGSFNLLAETGARFTGSASFSVSGDGSFDKPDIKANVQAYKLYFRGVDMGAGEVNGRIVNDVMTVSGSVLDKKVAMDGFMGLSKPYTWRGRLTFNGGGFEHFVRLEYKDLPDDVALVSTGVFTGEGSLDDSSRTVMSLDFSKVSASIMGRTLENVGDVSFSYRDGRLSVKSFKLKGKGVELGAEGVSTGLEELDVRLSLSADLEIMKKFVEENVDYLDGTCQAELALKGNLKNPTLSGRVKISNAGLKFKEFPQRFDNIAAEVKLDKGEFTLTRMDAKLGGGSVTASGKGALKGLTIDTFSIRLNASDVKVKYPEELLSTVDAKLLLEGAEQSRDINGDIIIRKSRYTERLDWKTWIITLQKKKTEVASVEENPVGATSLNVHVTADRSIKIDNNVAKMPVSADLYLRGTIEHPLLIGRLESAGGTVFFRNNEFKLINAVAEFADPRKFNPIIDLQAETKVREYDIQLNLTGNLDRIKVSLFSDPPLEDADIITLLTVGRTSEGIKGHESALTTGEAASFVTGQIQDAVEGRMRKITGFDRFQIDPYLTSSGVSTGPRLTVGKSILSDKLMITYSTNPGTSVDQFVRLEYTFNKNLSLVGERDELGRVGGDIKFRFEFK